MLVQGAIFNIQKFSIHDGPGIRTVVFFKGCPLRCYWCSNPESQRFGILPEPQVPEVRLPTETANPAPSLGGKHYSIDEVMEICLQDRAFYEESGGGVTLSGGEVLAQADFAEALLTRLGETGIHRVIESTGHAPPKTFTRIIARTELILFDIKHYDSIRHSEGTGVPNDLVLQNFREALARGRQVLPRIPVIPGYNDSPEDAAGFATLLLSAGVREVQLLPFHQFGHNKYALLGLDYRLAKQKALHPEDLEPYRAVFEQQGIRSFF
ncbi:MAG: glycyl-radical enzyme activating protein [Treponema sp.]|jgi:pyruvate formate lyase activating enzyme|nr:glycyl-radical enzyme activating protein [Treponema sp.]